MSWNLLSGQPYGTLRTVGEDLFCIDGEWYNSPLRRRMTVIRLPDGSLVIHSAIALDEKDYPRLDSLGPVVYIVVPNRFHNSDAPAYASRFSQAKVYVPKKCRADCAKRMRVTGTLEDDWPLSDELPRISFENSLVAESAFVHARSRTLILTDMAFNVSAVDFSNPLERFLLGKCNGILDCFGPSKLTRYIAARDRQSVSRALREISKYDFDRVIMSHGRIIETAGKERLFDGYARVYGADILR